MLIIVGILIYGALCYTIGYYCGGMAMIKKNEEDEQEDTIEW